MSKKVSGNDIRRAFIGYFVENGHRKVKSSNLIPSADPTLLFTNAGMVPFKDLFLGREKRDYSRAVSVQKCLRVSGKHNDLEEVGRTNRHNTFFEMLGNFSFGDYFKEDAIRYAWEFLTDRLEIPAERLSVTVFTQDDDAARLWEKVVGLPEDKIIRLGEKDNFWSMGATGPCGPCSEIFIDNGKEAGCGKPDCAPGCDCERYEEIWNLVFMQYDRDKAGKLNPLPNPSIDTGMGLERLASVQQAVRSNFDTDLIRPLIAIAEDVLEVGYGKDNRSDVSLRVIGDHIRTAAFLITEGVLPSNDDRGYVLRRIMRRAMRHGKMLGAKEPFLYRIIGGVIDNFREPYPELADAEDTMARIIQVEELRFGKTLENGLRILGGIVEKAKSGGGKKVDGVEIFKLYDTYGFPIDLATDVIADAGLGFDRAEFESEMENQRTLARSSAKTGSEEVPERYKGLEEEITGFEGYDRLELETKIDVLIKDGKKVDRLAKGEKGEVILAETPFYAESGGQAGDRGLISSMTGRAKVLDTKKPLPSVYSHHVEVTDGELESGQETAAKVNAGEREATRRNHTATHLLHAALKAVLGEHVKQAGSSVAPERFRFDFSHYAAVTTEELRQAEEMVNEVIRRDIHITTEEMSTDKAIESGATALFGEKYGATVRVVAVEGFSTELCGGTHAGSTGEIGVIKIVSESGVAAGVRRIEGLSGAGALGYLLEQERKLKSISGILKSSPDESEDRVAKLVDKTKELEKEIKKLKSDKARGDSGASGEEREVAGVKVLVKKLDGVDVDTLRNVVDEAKVKIGSGVVLAGTVTDGKVILIAGVTKDLTKKLQAGKIVKEAAAIVGGGGGGRPDMAQAGGTDVSKIDEAIGSVFNKVEKLISE
jgi:alanyl-tRNA synthetase